MHLSNSSDFSTVKVLRHMVLSLECIDMSETWKFMEEEETCCHQNRSSRRGPDILLWVEFYSMFIAVLASQFQPRYHRWWHIRKPFQKLTRHTVQWTRMGNIRSKANTKCLDWDVIDFTLYNETFSGWAKVIPRWYHCSSVWLLPSPTFNTHLI